MPYGEGAVLPVPPLQGSLIVEGEQGSAAMAFADPNPVVVAEEGVRALTAVDFWLSLPPGDYRILGIETGGGEFGPGLIMIPTMGPEFTVAWETQCTYLGQLNVSFFRLPALSDEEKAPLLGKLMDEVGHDLQGVYLGTGDVVVDSLAVDVPESIDEQPDGADECKLDPASW